MDGGIPRGTTIGSYVIDGPLGRGGMGVVYRAFHPRLQRWAAIKVLPPFTDGSDARGRFEREARAVARLRHRHILTVFDFGEFADQPYMAVEFMPNGSLQDRMPAGPVTPEEAVTVLRPLAEALDYAHAQGVLHRDVKPANVFLDGELQPVLADFGLAKLYSEESLTATGMVSGTPTHISPEQANGGPLSGATDQYSLGVIAYQLLAGRLPFQGALMELLYAHVNTVPEPPSRFNPALSPLVDEAVLRALAKEPAERCGSCAEMVGALEAAAAGRADARRPRPVAPAVVETAGATVVLPQPPVGPPARGRRRLAWAAAAAVLVLALTTAGVVGAAKLAAGSTPGGPGATSPPTAAPTSRRLRTVTVTPSTVSPGGSVTVAGRGFEPGTQARAGFVKGGFVEPLNALDIRIGADGAYRQEGVVPRDLPAGEATLVVCDVQGSTVDLGRCARTAVTVR